MRELKEDIAIIMVFLSIIIAIIIYNKDTFFSDEQLNKIEVVKKFDTEKLNLFQDKNDTNSTK